MTFDCRLVSTEKTMLSESTKKFFLSNLGGWKKIRQMKTTFEFQQSFAS